MSKISKYGLWLMLIAFWASCKTPSNIPSAYLVSPKKVPEMTQGCWIIVNQAESGKSDELPPGIQGELIAADKDTFYILTRIGFISHPTEKINQAKLYIFRNQANTFGLITFFGLVPNVIGVVSRGMPEFFVIGIPYAAVGVLMTVLEGNSTANELNYPQTSDLTKFGRYARFPQGIPKEVDPKQLHLIE
ncbi:hypothetical protein [Gaoshiqia sediminis]|uniref:Lipoprotein n=1 Tax=Gaoshiqia sediminis TaxID=2986998 RepID=A0AA41YEK5_9BACT|nr:hypothetical protein [Gaoshiqia sediminis]MCW0484422.1 hypothetical protein [Gaoshiqia sediminis]